MNYICPECRQDLTNSVRILGEEVYTYHVELHRRHRLRDALEKIVDLHGSEEHTRHECTKMANVAREALERYRMDL